MFLLLMHPLEPLQRHQTHRAANPALRDPAEMDYDFLPERRVRILDLGTSLIHRAPL